MSTSLCATQIFFFLSGRWAWPHVCTRCDCEIGSEHREDTTAKIMVTTVRLQFPSMIVHARDTVALVGEGEGTYFLVIAT